MSGVGGFDGAAGLRVLVLLAAILFLPGCQALGEHIRDMTQGPEKEVSPDDDSLEVARTLEKEFQWLANASPAERVARFNNLEATLREPVCTMETIRLAMLYQTMDNPDRKHGERIKASLQTCNGALDPPVPSGMVRLLQKGVAYRLSSQDRTLELEQEIQLKEEENAALREQLEALRDLERSLRERDP